MFLLLFDGLSVITCASCSSGPKDPELLLADRKDLRKIHLETYHYTLLVSEEKVFGAIAMDFDYDDNMLFWTDVAVEQILK